jgi:hypothetical protein
MSSKRTWSRRIARVFALLIFALPLAAQDSLQFNVPYLCPDGSVAKPFLFTSGGKQSRPLVTLVQFRS